MKASVLSEEQKSRLHANLSNPIHYRKSGLSLNHIIGCPLECSYCVRHKDNNWEMKQPHMLMSNGKAVETLLNHKYFQKNITPIQIFNKATDSMLPSVKPHLFEVLKLLDEHQLTNHVLVITRYKITNDDCSKFNQLKNLKLSILVTYSGIKDKKIEPIDNKIPISSLKTAFENAKRYRVILYWRPIIPGFNDSNQQIDFALNDLSKYAHATVFTGLFYNAEIKNYFEKNGLPEIYENIARRKIFPEELERRILLRVKGSVAENKLFRKTSCGVSFSHKLPDYNGHFGIQDLCDICPEGQFHVCQINHKMPTEEEITANASKIAVQDLDFHFDKDRSIIVNSLNEEDRYFMQHTLNFQVHSIDYPHKIGQHGRADEYSNFIRQ